MSTQLRLFLLTSLLTLAGCGKKFSDRFQSVDVVCGRPDTAADPGPWRAFRPVGPDGKTLAEGPLQAYFISDDGQRSLLNWTSKSCVYLPQNQSGTLAFVNRDQQRVAVKALRPQSTEPRLEQLVMQDLLPFKLVLNCSGQDIWTRQPFFDMEWQLEQGGQTMSPELIQNVAPLLQLDIKSRSSRGVVQQSLNLAGKWTSQVNLSAQKDRTFITPMALPSESESLIEFSLNDILDRRQTIEGGASCRIRMTTKNPVVLTFDSATGPIRLDRGRQVRLETLEGATLYTQVVPLSVEYRIKKWDELTAAEQDNELLTFKPGRSPVFWQEGTYILRAFSQDRAGNRSPIWERRIQVPESVVMENQINHDHWILQKASRDSGPALVSAGLRDGVPTIAFRSLPSNGDEDIWQPTLTDESRGLFRDAFGINRQLIEGRLGFKGSKNVQYCLVRGSNAADAHRESYLSRMFCWERQGQTFTIVYEGDAPFFDQEILRVGDYYEDELDEVLAISFTEQLNRFIKPQTADDGSITFYEDNKWENTYVITPSFWDSFKDYNAEGRASETYFYQTDLGRLVSGVLEFTPGTAESRRYIVSLDPSRYSMPYYTLDWGPYTEDFRYWQNLILRWSLRVQVVPGFLSRHPGLIITDSRSATRWVRSLYTRENPENRNYNEESLDGLPSAASDNCYFYVTDTRHCLSFAVDPHARKTVRHYTYQAAEKSWSLQGSYSLDGMTEEKLIENPSAIRGIVTIPIRKAYRADPKPGSTMRWAVLPLQGIEKMPAWGKLKESETARLKLGTGTLQVWGQDERFAVWIWTGDSEVPVARELRFAGAIALSSDLGHGLGLVDLKGDSHVQMIQALPGDQGLASLDFTRTDRWKIQRDWQVPAFVNAPSNPLGWHGRSVSFVSGRLLPDVTTPVFCYLARPSFPQDHGTISCYGYRDPASDRIEKLHEGPLPMAEDDDFTVLKIAGSDLSGLMSLNKTSSRMRVRVLVKNSAGTYEVKTVPWVRTVNENGTVRISESLDELQLADINVDGNITTQVNYRDEGDLEPNQLHLTGQLQTGAGTSRFSLTTTIGGIAIGGQLKKAPVEELSLSLNKADILIDPDYVRRTYLFNQWELDFDEDITSTTIYSTMKRRAFFANSGVSTFINNKGYCRTAVERDFGFEAALIASCNFFWIQTDAFLTGSWENRFEFNEAPIQAPDRLETHWTYPFWVQDPVAIYALRAPKNMSSEGWSVEKTGPDVPLMGFEDSWTTVRSFSLNPGN